MSRSKDLIKNTGILMIGKVSTQFVSFLLLPLYTNKLATGEYGILDVYTTIASILIPVLTLQLEQGVFRFLITSDQPKEKVLSSTAAYLLSVTIVATLIFFPVAQSVQIKNSLYLYLYYITNMIYVVVVQVARGEGNNILYSFASFLSSVLIIIFNTIFLVPLNYGVNGILLSHAIAYIATTVVVIFALKLYRHIRIANVSVSCLKELLGYSIPLVFNQISSWVINYSDRLIILAILGVSANGIYALANKFFTLLVTVFNIYNMAWTEIVAKAMGDKDRGTYFERIINVTVQLYLLICIWVIAGLGIGFKYFIRNPEYHDAYNYVPILIAAAVFSGLSATIGSIYIGHKKTKNIGITTLGAAIVNIIVHLGLIKFVGLYAASISTLVAFLALFLYRIQGIQKIEPIRISIRNFVIFCPLIALVWFLYLKEATVLQFISVAIAIVSTLIVGLRQKDTLKHLTTNLANKNKKKDRNE